MANHSIEGLFGVAKVVLGVIACVLFAPVFLLLRLASKNKKNASIRNHNANINAKQQELRDKFLGQYRYSKEISDLEKEKKPEIE